MSTHQIVSMEFGETANSKSPMWRCTCSDGTRVNVFQHADPAKNTALLFEHAGYMHHMNDMVVGQIRTWNACPIPVTLVQEGKWWNCVRVEAQPDAEPDIDLTPDPKLVREGAIRQAWELVRYPQPAAVWDTETTGALPDDEIISISSVNREGVIQTNSLIRPENLDRVERFTHVHGITAESVVMAPTFPDYYKELRYWFQGTLWLIYNAPFDTKMLENACTRHHLTPITPLAVVDVMDIFARFYGEWDAQHQRFAPKTLAFASENLGINVTEFHSSVLDAMTTLAVLRAIAALESSLEPDVV